MKVSVTENKELLDLVKAGLRRNKELYGKRYCPCRLEHTDDASAKSLNSNLLDLHVIVEFI